MPICVGALFSATVSRASPHQGGVPFCKFDIRDDLRRDSDFYCEPICRSYRLVRIGRHRNADTRRGAVLVYRQPRCASHRRHSPSLLRNSDIGDDVLRDVRFIANPLLDGRRFHDPSDRRMRQP
jgi:hypothetical protein